MLGFEAPPGGVEAILARSRTLFGAGVFFIKRGVVVLWFKKRSVAFRKYVAEKL